SSFASHEVVPDPRRTTSPALAMLQCPYLIESDRGERHGRGFAEYRRPQGAGAPGSDRDGEPDAVLRSLARWRRQWLGCLSALQRPDGADDQGTRRNLAVD